MNAETEIRTFLDYVVEATRAKDIDALMRNYAPEVLAFDVIDPLQYSGETALRERAAAWFSSFHGAIDYELAELKIIAADGVAVCHGLSRVVGTTTKGGELKMWWRTTYGLQKRGDSWLITHVHSSVPFSPHSGAASLSLEP
jgi:ketosteroid isomerase-like protein